MSSEQKKRKRPSIETLKKIYEFLDKINEIDNATKINRERLREILEAMIAEGFSYIEAGDELRMLAKEKGIAERSLRRWLPFEAKHQNMTRSKIEAELTANEAAEDIKGASDYIEAELGSVDNIETLRGIAKHQFTRAEYWDGRVKDLEKKEEQLHKTTENLQMELDRASENLQLCQQKTDELRKELKDLKGEK